MNDIGGRSSGFGRAMPAVLVSLALLGCGSVPANSASDPTSATLSQTSRFMIKFREPDVDPSRSDVLRGLEHDAGAALVYVRAMSGGAHVMQLRNPADAKHLSLVIDRLMRRSDVEYAEPDRRLRPMRGPGGVDNH